MSLATQTSIVQYVANGVTTAFAFPYYFLENSHLVVIFTVSGSDSAPKVLGVDYSVTGAGIPAGGTVTFGVAPANGTVVTIFRSVPVTQLVDYVIDDNFPAETHEMALDKLTMICQYLLAVVNRCYRSPLTTAEKTPQNWEEISGVQACVNGEPGTYTLLGRRTS